MSQRKKPPPSEADHKNDFFRRTTEARASAKGYGGKRVDADMVAEARAVADAWSEFARELARMR